MHLRIILISAFLTLLAAPLAAQIALPGVQVPRIGGLLDPVGKTLDRTIDDTRRAADRLARDRAAMLDRLVRHNREWIERDARGEPARRGELLVMDADAADLERARAAGFATIGTARIDDLGMSVVRMRAPEDVDLDDAEEALAELLPAAIVSADNLHFQAGRTGAAVLPLAASSAAGTSRSAVGMIDGAPGKGVAVAEVRGFASGAPIPSNHGSAIASLLASAGVGTIRVADVYGTDKAGGNALAIARGLGWLVGEGSEVVTISLVGPRNPVLERAIDRAHAKGVVIVAAVGNDGPAAPPAYPASYDNVVAVTAVDGKRRALIEAGRARGLDYAAPGADITGLDARGKRVELRGTSFATPLVAARIARALSSGRNWRPALDAEAIDLGEEGRDEVYGRGLVCASCDGR